MRTTHAFPSNVAVRVEPSGPEGLAVSLCFESSKKNHFHYTLFSDRYGFAEVTGDQLLRFFDEDRSTFIMDYGDPRDVFTGRISARVLSNAELGDSIAALEMYRGKVRFPRGYEQALRAAVARDQKPEQYVVKLEVKWKS